MLKGPETYDHGQVRSDRIKIRPSVQSVHQRGVGPRLPYQFNVSGLQTSISEFGCLWDCISWNLSSTV